MDQQTLLLLSLRVGGGDCKELPTNLPLHVLIEPKISLVASTPPVLRVALIDHCWLACFILITLSFDSLGFPDNGFIKNIEINI